MIRIILVSAGFASALASVWLRAGRRLTINLTAVWGIFGIFLILAGIFPGAGNRALLYMEGRAGITRSRFVFLAAVILLLVCSFWLSVVFSKRQMRNRERAMEQSLLFQEDEKKKILFVINTMGRAGAERALLELLKKLDSQEYTVFLYVLMGQGELFEELPAYVKLLNSETSCLPVLSKEGRRRMTKTVFRAFFHNGKFVKKLWSMARSLTSMRGYGFSEGFSSVRKKRRLQISKLLWRVISDGADRFNIEFDLAVAWLEGGSAYYVADHVKAERKCVFIHIAYENAGYTREMDRDCYEEFDRIFTVSDEVKEHFQAFYPEYEFKTKVFNNIINQEMIRRRAGEGEVYDDSYQGTRLLTVGRLDYQKGYDISIEAMKLLKDRGVQARWYVLGEGALRKALEKKIAALGLEEDFLLMGAVENPYPYFVQADIYVHMTRYEGKSVAIQEAQTLGCAVVASDCNGNREQIADGIDGILCELKTDAIAESITGILRDEEKRKAIGQKAGMKKMPEGQQLELLLELLA